MNHTTTLPTVGFRSFAAMATVWLAAAYFSGQYVAVLPFGFVVIAVLVFAVPIAISGAFTSAVKQARMMSYYNATGWIYKIFSGRLIRSGLWILWALVSSFFMLLQFSTYSRFEWAILACAIPAFWYIHNLFNRFFSRELKKRYVISSFAITATRLFCPLLLVVLYALLVSRLTAGQSYESLAAAVAATRANTPEVAGSTVVQITLFFISFLDGTKAYLGSNLRQFGEQVPLVLIIVSSYTVFFNASATFACFVIPRVEQRRTFGPISDEEIPLSLTSARVAIAAAVVTVVTLFIYVPAFALLENNVRANADLIGLLKNAQLNVEKIDDEFYRPGTIKAIEAAKSAALGKITASRAIVDSQIESAFGRMESNVDAYLDWYYSLSGEYSRLAKLMTGEIEKYMEEKLVEKLKQEDALRPAIAALEVAFANQTAVTDAYRKDVKKILASNRLQVPGFGTKGIQGVSSDHILVIPKHIDVVSMKSRIAGGAAAGIGAGIVGKIVGKSIFKAAGKALSKVAVSKVAGTAGGAAIGATIGSVVPGAGTIIGGVIGGVIAGVVVDKTLLKLEETISRKNFRKEIIASIRESRNEFKDGLLGAQ